MLSSSLRILVLLLVAFAGNKGNYNTPHSTIPASAVCVERVSQPALSSTVDILCDEDEIDDDSTEVSHPTATKETLHCIYAFCNVMSADNLRAHTRVALSKRALCLRI